MPGVCPCRAPASLPTMQLRPTRLIQAGWPHSPAPPGPPLCPMAQGRALLPPAGLSGHGGGRATGTWGAGKSRAVPSHWMPTRCQAWAYHWHCSVTKPTASCLKSLLGLRG